MTLDELIAQAEDMRNRYGGQTAVLLITPRGYAYPALMDGVGFITKEAPGEAIVLIGPGEPSDARPS